MEMTIEKAISWLEELTFHKGEDVPIYDTDVEAINMAIKALKQESVIDKIRYEMLEEMIFHSGTGEEVIQAYADGLKKGLDFIDKYKVKD